MAKAARHRPIAPIASGSKAPPTRAALGQARTARDLLAVARTMAWRDGAGCVGGICTGSGPAAVEVQRVGAGGNMLLWRFPRAPPARLRSRSPPSASPARSASGSPMPGVLAALIDAEGCCSPPTSRLPIRAVGRGQSEEQCCASPIWSSRRGRPAPPARRGRERPPDAQRPVPIDPTEEGGAGTFLMFDTLESGSLSAAEQCQVLLELLPLGPGAGRPRRPLPDHEQGVPHRRRDQGRARCRPIPAIWWSRKTRRRWPTRCGAMRAARRCRAISRSGSANTGRAGRADDRRPARSRRRGGPAAAQGQ